MTSARGENSPWRNQKITPAGRRAEARDAAPGRVVAKIVATWLPSAPPTRGGAPAPKSEVEKHFVGRFWRVDLPENE